MDQKSDITTVNITASFIAECKMETCYKILMQTIDQYVSHDLQLRSLKRQELMVNRNANIADLFKKKEQEMEIVHQYENGIEHITATFIDYKKQYEEEKKKEKEGKPTVVGKDPSPLVVPKK